MPVKSLKSETGNVGMLGASVFCKIIIIDSGSTSHTVMDTYIGSVDGNHTISASVSKSFTDTLGNFKLRLANDAGRFYGTFDGGEQVFFYADTTNATTEIFRGYIDNVNYGLSAKDGFFVDITGRDFPLFTDKTVIGVDSAASPALALARLLYNNYSDIELAYDRGGGISTVTYNPSTNDITWSGIDTGYPTTEINTSYQHKKGWSVIKEICQTAGLGCHVKYNSSDSQLYLYTFPVAGIINADAAISFGTNLITLSNYGVDNDNIFNRVIGYGKQESDNIVLLKTEEDTDSQDDLWVKDKILNNSDVTTMTELQQLADSTLAADINLEANGRFTVVAMTNIAPGDIIPCSVPYCGVSGTHKIQSFTHSFGKVFTTAIELTRKTTQMIDLFVEKLNPDDFIAGGSNLNSMKDSYTVYFDEDPSVITHDNTEEISGVLSLQAGKTYGIATADVITADYNVGSCEFRRYDNFSTKTDTYEVSNDNKTNWEVYSTANNYVHSFTTTGNQLAFRIKLRRSLAADTSPAYESVCLLYK